MLKLLKLSLQNLLEKIARNLSEKVDCNFCFFFVGIGIIGLAGLVVGQLAIARESFTVLIFGGLGISVLGVLFFEVFQRLEKISEEEEDKTRLS